MCDNSNLSNITMKKILWLGKLRRLFYALLPATLFVLLPTEMINTGIFSFLKIVTGALAGSVMDNILRLALKETVKLCNRSY